ncbi:MAG: cyclase family protein [Chloroflexota bacterium]
MKLHDISITLSPETTTYPGDASVTITPTHRISFGDGYNSSLLKMGTHAGTHIDPPSHMLEGGASLDEMPLDAFVGKSWVAELDSIRSISAADLAAAGIPEGTERLLLKTKNSQLWERPGFQDDFVYIEPGAAQWIVQRGIGLVGFDYLTVESISAPSPETHLILMRAGIAIVEGLDLREIPPGAYTLICLPLRIKGGDGAPARAILLQE